MLVKLKMKRRLAITFAVAAALAAAAAVSAQGAVNPAEIIADTICSLIPEAASLAWWLALLMFIYGGAKYAYGADDPGARKQGKNIAVNAMIGLIIVAVAYSLITAIAGGDPCP